MNMNNSRQAQYDNLVFIGRFQPFHLGHLQVVKQALLGASRVFILCGSANQPRSARNPLTFEERAHCIRASLSEEERCKVTILPLDDCLYQDDQWVHQVKMRVNAHIDGDQSTGLIGHCKDHSSYYLQLFPEWGRVDVASIDPINATDIRQGFFKNQTIPTSYLTKAAQETLQQFLDSRFYDLMVEEVNYIERYQQSWQAAPFTPNFVTVDALVVCQQHALVIQRKHCPGKGLLALPGGFLEPTETIFEGCLRELSEETQLTLEPFEARRQLVRKEVFDQPARSARGRTITHAYYFELGQQNTRPKVIASDDAIDAYWLPIKELRACDFFEDHYFIIQSLLNVPSLNTQGAH
ncbi:bifunctional nicotinamide-nucleotide adenylyltransferase/Nudix hydroxylase [bacterium]|nr:bifunctional nicotinamide-nucleotide adenylyltransferase/Nudix hydroxylase [bacterium]